jgi:V8-like Glu-specific endopeptidase
VGTGVLLAHKQLLTAGHNLFSYTQSKLAENIREYNPFPSKVVFYVGKNGFSYLRKYELISQTVHGNYINNGINDLAIASLKLNKGKAHKVFKFSILRGGSQAVDATISNTIKKIQLTLSGYPGEKVKKEEKGLIGELHEMEGIVSHIDNKNIEHNMHTTEGQSGSPIWFVTTYGQIYVAAIHINGATCRNSSQSVSNRA